MRYTAMSIKNTSNRSRA